MDNFIEKVKQSGRMLDTALIQCAYEFACEAHKDQKRMSGEPYVVHPCAVAEILINMDMDSSTIAAALLHDVVEDTPVTLEELTEKFGEEIAHLVSGMTKISYVEYQSTEERQAENIRRMLFAMADDIRVILIRLADRLHNMRTLQYQKPERQKAIARETLDVYAPLAHRLGIFSIKWELEDLSLKYLDPEEYDRIDHLISQKHEEREEEIRKIIASLHDKVTEMGVTATIEGRPKHFYSIYRKMHLQNKAFEQIYDILAVRIIVNSVKDCYGVLGMVHTMYKPIPGRFKDYIAVPKENLYQSLHTTLISERGMPFEIQIRTWDMHRTAEYGIASHWKYKENQEGKPAGDTDLDVKLKWLRSILEWQDETRDAKEFMDTLKLDLFNDEIFVFTPKSEVVNLPLGATPIDFAYYIHSAVGNKCVGAKINGRMAQLDTPLKTGDIVEIITSNTAKGPSRDWLKIVKSTQARSKIRAWFKKEFKEENIERGHTMLEEAAKKHEIALTELLKPEWLKKIYKRYTLNSLEDMYAAIGCGGIPASQICGRLVEEHKREVREAQRRELDNLLHQESQMPQTFVPRVTPNTQKPGRGVTVKGERGMLVRYAKCCNPVEGDDIVGFITRGRGVSIHRKDCPNIGEMLQDASRIIAVAWETDEVSPIYRFRLTALDRPGLFVDVTSVITANELRMVEVNAQLIDGSTAEMTIAVETTDTFRVETMIKTIRRMPEVQEIVRI